MAFWHKLIGSPSPVPDITGWLDACGLDWRTPRAELALRHGISSENPYQWELVELAANPPPMEGLLRPFSFQAFDLYSPQLPPARLSAHVWRGDDARDNLAWAMEQLASRLGKTRMTSANANTLEAEWRNGRASVRLLAWPPDLQSFRLTNPAHERDPRLDTACSIDVQTGWRPALSEREAGWLASARIIAESGIASSRDLFGEPMLEYMRDARLPASGLYLAGAREALLLQAADLLILPCEIITSFSVSRLLPAKGSGGSSLNALCQRCDGGKDRSVLLAQRGGPDDLNELGEQMAALFRKPIVLGPYEHDC